jgi:hypothetical protein
VEEIVSAPVQTGPGTHQAYYEMGTGYLSRGGKRPGRGINHTPPSSTEVKETVELYLHSLVWAFMACLRVNFTFTFNIPVQY